jgi:hypothetical protein
MLLHLPIAILVTLSPVAVSDTVPKFDIVRECRFEGGSTADFDRCSDDESAALRQLETSGRSLSVPAGANAWPLRRSAVSRAMSSC